MTSNQLTEQQIDLLIENGYDIAHTLENLAENESIVTALRFSVIQKMDEKLSGTGK
ncbi:TPA: hypothetical protein MD953_000226 [Klebsiella pneumoniae]|nr:hypothetical protein [Klebsiella pneumoniae]